MHFYSHIIEIQSITEALESLDLSDEEKVHLGQLIDANIHNTILYAILDELSEKDKELFMDKVASKDHQEIWDFLNGRVENVEGKIQKVAEELKKELHEDIKDAKRLKGGK